MWWRRKRYLSLGIDLIILRAEAVAEAIVRQLPDHDGLANLAGNVVESAKEAQRCTRAMGRPWSLHRLPPIFLFTSLLLLLGWVYLQYVHVPSVRIAISSADASDLKSRLEESSALRAEIIETAGSTANLKLLAQGEVDLAFVQGGIEIPADLPRHEVHGQESVLLLLRPGVSRLNRAGVILTSTIGQGSHSVLGRFLKALDAADPPKLRHEWHLLSGTDPYEIPEDVGAVFVVKDLADQSTLRGVQRLTEAGFTLASPMLGSRGAELDFLDPIELPRAHLLEEPPIPPLPVRTYGITSHLVARAGLSPALQSAIHRLLTEDSSSPQWGETDPTDLELAGQVLGAIKALVDLLIFIGLAFVALLGFEIASFRQRFHQLNTIITLIGIHQGNKDISPGLEPAIRRDHLLYFDCCIDLLCIVDAIGGVYVQRNAALLYSNLLTAVSQRSSSLEMTILQRMLLLRQDEHRT